MDPQHLARLDDDGTVRRSAPVQAGGSAAAPSPTSPEVPEPAPVGTLVRRLTGRSRRLRGASPLSASTTCPVRTGSAERSLPAGAVLPGHSDAWPLALDVDALLAAGAARPEPVGRTPVAELTAEQVVARLATGGRRHRRFTPVSRPRLAVAAALLGVTGLALTAAGHPVDVARAADADQPTSVAAELGLLQAEQPVLTEDVAASRLQQLLASRAEREDEQAAAARVQAEADRVASDAAAAAAAAAAEAARPAVVLPVQGARLTSGFGNRWGTLHAGIDLAAPMGTPEYAVMDGVVVRAGAASGFGLAVYVQHENGDVTVYGHMQEILVAEGQRVRAGDPIALVGNRGQSTGPHLHFEVHVGGIDGTRIDPLPWLRERGVAL
ncbi:M23 family metallopeptidase [Modestobacter muralis]|uniref:M23 family metallopeptidase n=1 Tax=Modestobacter muralis TaxID=1608614 RepID=A0A6P0EYG2_9ACTN|nr:M23 family metallopeptidase [Modestobacter muralis]NEK94318.1 M23 family metallopeptidase [Modestobacter muralis]NEN51206.1 M23 family metallopeptidase [Modestobacter muralis]